MLLLVQLNRKHFLAIALFVIVFQIGSSQNTHVYNHDDTLRGSITPQRAWWDVIHYTLKVKPDLNNQSIYGVNFIRFKSLKTDSILQIDLQSEMKIDSVIYLSQKCKIKESSINTHLVFLPAKIRTNTISEIAVYYHGKPVFASSPPQKGGFQWGMNDYLPYVVTSCLNLGGSSWIPCKDHPSDKPDSMQIEITVPKDLVAVSNGRLQNILNRANEEKTFVWVVKNPINISSVNLNIGDYAHFSDTYIGEKGKLYLDYYVLPDNLDRAKIHFEQVKKMLKAFEYWFGPYPFYEDGYKLVEVPYLGMEHQSDISYGNGFVDGYRGSDLSRSGWGMKWDYVIVHDSGHEWFGNSITASDLAEKYIHESFATYGESLYTEHFYGKEAANAYTIGDQDLIHNIGTLVGDYNVSKEPTEDIYWRGASMLNTLRQIVDNDSLWRKILRGINTEFYHKSVSSKQFEDYVSKTSRLKLNPFFNQYLRDTRPPKLEYKFEDKLLNYRFSNCIPEFTMPIRIKTSSDSKWIVIKPTTKWQKLKLKTQPPFEITIDPNYLVKPIQVK